MKNNSQTNTDSEGVATSEQRKKAFDKTIGIQIDAYSFMDEGTEKVLDILQEKGAVNALCLTTFSYDRGITGRQIPGRAFPDHGAQETDEKIFHGGNYATPHPEYYKNTILKNTKAPDFGKLDIVAEVLPAAKKRGMKVYCSVQDGFEYPDDVPGVKELSEIDLNGNRSGAMCFYNPDVRAFWSAVVTDLCKSYKIDGILLFNERGGPFLNALGASHNQSIASTGVTCFCQHHQNAAKEAGIDYQRTREGYLKLNQFVQAALKGQRPSDGYYVEFARILIEYPEIQAWNKLFDKGKNQVLSDVRSAAKGVNKNLEVGFHVEHVNSFNPVYRATRSYSVMAEIADFLKVVVYNNAAGERYASFIRNAGSIVFRDVPLELLMEFNNYLLNYANEAELNELASSGLSADYVFRETQRALAGVQGKSKIFPGIEIGIGSRKASPKETYEATYAAFQAGADGIILSRKYSEMMLANLTAAGDAVKDAAKAGLQVKKPIEVKQNKN